MEPRVSPGPVGIVRLCHGVDMRRATSDAADGNARTQSSSLSPTRSGIPVAITKSPPKRPPMKPLPLLPSEHRVNGRDVTATADRLESVGSVTNDRGCHGSGSFGSLDKLAATSVRSKPLPQLPPRHGYSTEAMPQLLIGSMTTGVSGSLLRQNTPPVMSTFRTSDCGQEKMSTNSVLDCTEDASADMEVMMTTVRSDDHMTSVR